MRREQRQLYVCHATSALALQLVRADSTVCADASQTTTLRAACAFLRACLRTRVADLDAIIGNVDGVNEIHLGSATGTFTAQTQATNSFVQVCAYDPTKFAEYGVQDGECSKYTNEFGEQSGSERDGANSRCICRPDVGGVAQAANTIDLSCGDYDNDGKMDLVVANKGYMSNDNAAQNMYNYVQTQPSINELHKGNGDGTFTAIVTSVVVHASGLVKQNGNPNPFQFQINQATTSIDFVDLDSDGFLDIVVGSWNKDYDVDSADGNCMRAPTTLCGRTARLRPPSSLRSR